MQPPPPGQHFVEVDASEYLTVGRLDDGRLQWAGGTPYGPIVLPSPPAGRSYVDIDAVAQTWLGKLSDTSLVESTGQLVLPCTVPGIRPGVGYRAIARSAVFGMALLEPGSLETFALGCAGSQPAATMRAVALPRIGHEMVVEIDNLPTSVAVVISGCSNLTSAFGPLPFDLDGLGLPGCLLRVGPDVLNLVVGSAGSAEHTWAIPPEASLIGVLWHMQAIVPDAAANAGGAVMSDAVTAIIGPPSLGPRLPTDA